MEPLQTIVDEISPRSLRRLTEAPRDMPLPPRRPSATAQLLVPTPALPRIIPGAVPILPGHAFLPFQWASR